MGASVWRVGRTADDRLMYRRSIKGSFNCYVKQWGMGMCVSKLPEKGHEGICFNVISMLRGWVGVNFPEKKRYLTLKQQRPETDK